MTDILVIKLNEKPESQEDLKIRAEKSWKINPSRLKNIKYVIVLFKQEVVAEYELLPNVKYNLETGRVELQFKDVDNNILGLMNKQLDYNTSNPCTIASLNKLEKLVF